MSLTALSSALTPLQSPRGFPESPSSVLRPSLDSSWLHIIHVFLTTFSQIAPGLNYNKTWGLIKLVILNLIITFKGRVILVTWPPWKWRSDGTTQLFLPTYNYKKICMSVAEHMVTWIVLQNSQKFQVTFKATKFKRSSSLPSATRLYDLGVLINQSGPQFSHLQDKVFEMGEGSQQVQTSSYKNNKDPKMVGYHHLILLKGMSSS